MRNVYYYQADYNTYQDVMGEWKKLCETGDIPAADHILIKPIDYRFRGEKGELSFFISHYSDDYADLIIVIGKVLDDTSRITTMNLQNELANIVMCYPEVNFVFENAIDVIPNISFSVGQTKLARDNIITKELICANSIKDKEFIKFLHTLNNIYDASNLRYFFRMRKLSKLKLHNNYEHTQCQRAAKLALSIDEEAEQCMLNGYLMYANGYRSLPIMSSTQLKAITGCHSINYDIILRDFDLQFPDGGDRKVNLIRGYQLQEERANDTRWECKIVESNDYWRKEDYDNNRVFVVTQGYPQLSVDPLCNKIDITPNKEKLIMPGLIKPLCGVYQSIRRLSPFRTSITKTYIPNDVNLARVERNHKYALDLYDKALKMFERARCYYAEERFVLAAVVSQETLELLNCFHTALSIQVYHLHVIAENAIAMSVMGGDEKELAKDCEIRVCTIKKDIRRLLSKTELNDKNVLNQIFSDCRTQCQEKEHFLSEEVFIGEMAFLNDGIPDIPLVKKLVNIVNELLEKGMNKLEERINLISHE